MAAKGADGEEVSQCLPDSRQRRPSRQSPRSRKLGQGASRAARGEARRASSSRSLSSMSSAPPRACWSLVGDRPPGWPRASAGRARRAPGQLGALVRSAREDGAFWPCPRSRTPAPRSVGRGPRRGVVATRPPDGHTPRPRHAPAPPPPRPCAPSSGGMRRSERRQGLNGARHPATPSGPQRRRYTPAGGVATPQEYPASRPWSHDALRGNIPAAGRGARHCTDKT